jgi:hypothetical protein
MIRLLIPEALSHQVPDMIKGCKEVVLTRGPWAAMGLQEAVEILFEDNSSNPFALFLDARTFDLLPKINGRWSLSIWTEGLQKHGEFRARVRRGTIPCLKSWKKFH